MEFSALNGTSASHSYLPGPGISKEEGQGKKFKDRGGEVFTRQYQLDMIGPLHTQQLNPH